MTFKRHQYGGQIKIYINNKPMTVKDTSMEGKSKYTLTINL